MLRTLLNALSKHALIKMINSSSLKLRLIVTFPSRSDIILVKPDEGVSFLLGFK